MNDHQAMLAIQQALDGVEWTPDTLERIAEILQQTGYRVRDRHDRDIETNVVLPGARNPEKSAHVPEAGHILATLREDDVRVQIAAILENDPDFDLTPDAVSDEEIRNACLSLAAKIDLSEEIGNAAFKAALTALGEAGRRRAGRR